MCSYRVSLTVGHESTVGGARCSEATHDWRLYVRGARGEDISPFVSKIVFTLHQSYTYPKRVIHEPPYEIKESGYGCFEVPIYIYIKHSTNPSKIKFRYKLFLQNQQLSGSQKFSHVFEDPPELLKSCLIEGGARIVEKPPPAKADMDAVPRVPPVDRWRAGEEQLKRRHNGTNAVDSKRRKREPEVRNGEVKRTSDVPVNGVHRPSERTVVNSVKKVLASVEMSTAETELVSQLYMSLRRYEAAATSASLRLPSFANAIYRVPELPRSLRGLAPDDDECGRYVLR